MMVTETARSAVASSPTVDTPPALLWYPGRLNLGLRVSPDPSLEVRADATMTLRPDGANTTIAPSTLAAKVLMDGQVVQEINAVGKVTAEERAAMAGVRDAFLGTGLLERATPPTGGDLALNTARFSWDAVDGKTVMVDVDIEKEQGNPKLVAFMDALDAYGKVAGFEGLGDMPTRA